jgi:hypothetical protein
MRAHRVAWTLFKGDVPAGQYVCHGCDNRACVNPDHLFLGDAQANTSDMVAKNRKHVPPIKEFCVKGHRRSYRSGRFLCQECNRASALRWFRRNKSSSRLYGPA